MRRRFHRKHSTSRKGKNDQKNIQRYRKWILSKKAKVAVGLLSIFLGVVGWHLNTCTLERRNRLQEFKKASRERRIANEKTIQAMLTYNSTENLFASYLTQDDVRLEEIQRFQDQFASIARDINDSCNTLMAAQDGEHDALHELTKYYDLENVGLSGGGGSCEGWRKFVVIASNTDSDQLLRLARDKSFRNKLVKGERSDIEHNTGVTESIRQVSRGYDEVVTQLIASLEKKEGSLFWSIWHCVIFPFKK